MQIAAQNRKARYNYFFIEVFEAGIQLMGSEIKKPLASEEVSRLNARRSIVLKKDLNSGHKLTHNDLICKRPGTGIPASKWDEVLEKKINKNLNEDYILSWEDLE